MNYYVYYVSGNEAREYLNGTNYVGLWSDSELQAKNKVRSYFNKNTNIYSVNASSVEDTIGYLY